MHIIVCLDDRNGMSFNGRRLSSDRAVCQQIIDSASGNIWMNGKAAMLFAVYSIRVDEDFLKKAGQDDSCFVEDLDFMMQLSRVKSITVYRWNRQYPSDVKLPNALLSDWRCVSTRDFPGNSHDVITEERYVP